MKKLIAVEAKSMLDIREKELLYLIVGDNPTEQVIINVGKKTFDSVRHIIETTGRPHLKEPTKLQIAEPEQGTDNISDELTEKLENQ